MSGTDTQDLPSLFSYEFGIRSYDIDQYNKISWLPSAHPDYELFPILLSIFYDKSYILYKTKKFPNLCE